MFRMIWEFPKIRGTILGVPIIRTVVFWGLYWGPFILGKYHIDKLAYLRAAGVKRLSIGMLGSAFRAYYRA